jgi:hypothetical protein
MTRLRTLMMALPLLAATAPAMAANLSGDYTITVTGGRGIAMGSTACVTLAQTGQVLHFANSGTATLGGTLSGTYYALDAVLTIDFGGGGGALTMSGVLYQNTLTKGTLTEIDGSGNVGAGVTFTATPGCTQP